MNPTFVKPRYDAGGFASLPGSIQSVFSGGEPFPAHPHEYDNLILLFVDGFGWRHFEKFGEAPLPAEILTRWIGSKTDLAVSIHHFRARHQYSHRFECGPERDF